MNGVATHLTDSATASWANAVIVSGTDLYVAGSYENYSPLEYVATYWKNNNQVTDLDIFLGSSSSGYSIAVSGANVLLGGTFSGSACYWTGWALTYVANNASTPALLFLK